MATQLSKFSKPKVFDAVKLRQMKSFLFSLTALALGAPFVHAQDSAPLEVKRVAERAKYANLFAPRGWKTEKIARGDLNRDGRIDAAIVLIENKPATDKDGIATDRKRALVIAFNDKRGWKRVGFNNQLLLGTRDGGAFYGMSAAPVEVSIEKGVVLVNMEFGSREVTTTTHILRWEPKRHAVYVLGVDTATRDRNDGSFKASSVNYLMGVKRVMNSVSNGKNTKTVISKGARQWRWLGAVKENDRYQA